VIACLRIIGILNAAVWLGIALFLIVGVGPATSSPDMRELLGATNFPYFSRAIARILVTRCLHLQLVCLFVGLAHLLTEGLYFGRGLRWFRLGLLLGLFWINLVVMWAQPKLAYFHLIEYGTGATPERRQAAHQSARVWQAVAGTLNVLTLGGVAVYLWRVANPPDSARWGRGAKFRS
jgi:hypothetical protein